MDNYDEWLTEMIITHGVERGHEWLVLGNNRTLPDIALQKEHWTLRGGLEGWHFTQKAIDYLRERNK